MTSDEVQNEAANSRNDSTAAALPVGDTASDEYDLEREAGIDGEEEEEEELDVSERRPFLWRALFGVGPSTRGSSPPAAPGVDRTR